MERLTVAVVSSRSRFCDIGGNLKHFAVWVRRAKKRGARLVCFPELALPSYTLHPRILDVAESVPGPATEALAKIAAENDVHLSVGMAERDGGKYHIAQIVAGPKGYLGKYRKHHPTKEEKERGFSAGTDFPTFQIDGFTLGINLCFDGRHHDTIEPMKQKQVDIVHHPHGNLLELGRDAEEWTRGKMAYLVSRAVHARAYLLANNSAGDTASPDGAMAFGSGAMVLDPLGQVVTRTAQKTRSEKMVVATLVKPLSALIPPFEL